MELAFKASAIDRLPYFIIVVVVIIIISISISIIIIIIISLYKHRWNGR